MTHEKMQQFEQELLARGYKRWDCAKYGTEDYDVLKLFRNEEGDDLYQIIFKFWDWSKYPQAIEEGDVDCVVMPYFDGRADLQLCQLGTKDKVLNVDWVENMAKDFHCFITERII